MNFNRLARASCWILFFCVPSVNAQNVVDTSAMLGQLNQISNQISQINNDLKLNQIHRQTAIDAFDVTGKQALSSQPSDRFGVDAAQQYLKVSPAETCRQQSAFSAREQAEKVCVAELNLFAENIRQIDDFLTRIEQHYTQLRRLSQRSYDNNAELQQLQLAASIMQTQIQSDMMKMSWSLQAYQEKKNWYRRLLAAQNQQLWHGNGLAVGFPASLPTSVRLKE